MDESTHGVVYMNFGTNVRSAELPAHKKQAFLNVFRKLKQTVIWKWEDDNLEDKPNNVVTRKWLPQKEILGKIKNLLGFTYYCYFYGSNILLYQSI